MNTDQIRFMAVYLIKSGHREPSEKPTGKSQSTGRDAKIYAEWLSMRQIKMSLLNMGPVSD
jgi:hypothetical protein